MKCHWCKKELEPIEDGEDPNQSHNVSVFECPDVHAKVCINRADKQITHYKLTWDADEKAEQRYALVWAYGETTLTYTVSHKYYRGRAHSRILFKSPTMIPILIDDDIIDMGTLIQRLKKLKAFY